MKKLIALLMCITCILGCTVASADKSVCILSPFVDEQSMARVSTGYDYPEQICYLTIKLVYEQSDGTTVEVGRQVPSYRIVFKVTYTYGDTGCVLGGYVSQGKYPRFEEYTNNDFNYDLNVSFNRLTFPTTSVTNLGDQYNLLIIGGTYEVTYHSVLYFDLNGKLVDTDTSTITRAYYYEETHDQP